MYSFVSTHPQPQSPALLDVAHGGVPYAFRFQHASYECHAGNYCSRTAHTHDIYHLLLYAKGKNRFLLNGGAHACNPGTLVFSGPGESHSFGSYDGGPVEYVEVTFSMEGPSGNLRLSPAELLSKYAGADLPAVNYPVQLHAREAAFLQATMERVIKTLISAQRLHFYTAQRFLIGAFTFLFNDIYAPQSAAGVARDDPLEEAKEIIETRFAEKLTIAGLARQAHLSTGYFQRAFKRAFGISPIAYQQRQRIQAAKTLLTATALRCKEIARRTGFANEYAFSRIFKLETGLAPGAYRRAQQNKLHA